MCSVLTNNFLLAVFAVCLATFGSMFAIEECTETCIDYYRNCAPIGDLKLVDNEYIDCTTNYYKLRCPMTCKVCVQCDVQSEIEDIKRRLTDLENDDGSNQNDGPAPVVTTQKATTTRKPTTTTTKRPTTTTTRKPTTTTRKPTTTTKKRTTTTERYTTSTRTETDETRQLGVVYSSSSSQMSNFPRSNAYDNKKATLWKTEDNDNNGWFEYKTDGRSIAELDVYISTDQDAELLRNTVVSVWKDSVKVGNCYQWNGGSMKADNWAVCMCHNLFGNIVKVEQGTTGTARGFALYETQIYGF